MQNQNHEDLERWIPPLTAALAVVMVSVLLVTGNAEEALKSIRDVLLITISLSVVAIATYALGVVLVRFVRWVGNRRDGGS